MLGNKHLVTSICSAYWLLFMCTSSLFCPLKACGRRAAGNMIFQKGVCGGSGWTGLWQSAGDAPSCQQWFGSGTTEHWVIRLHVRLLWAQSNLCETGCGPWLKDENLLQHHFLALRVLTTTLHFPDRKTSQRLSRPASSRKASLADGDAAA